MRTIFAICLCSSILQAVLSTGGIASDGTVVGDDNVDNEQQSQQQGKGNIAYNKRVGGSGTAPGSGQGSGPGPGPGPGPGSAPAPGPGPAPTSGQGSDPKDGVGGLLNTVLGLLG
ncbi:sperm-associated antigen 8-like [Halyomorpha halys]|uniref:sperm-associated antigen 8-like n=1 Tax=Halyomorpha halys TaxID=286706 RepID=UPI0034D20A86